jgi:2-furoate---CoA ligase
LIVDTGAPASFSAYWRKPEETAAVLVDDWYFTGDAARRTDDGAVVITGRTDDLIISGGENIHPAEVEDVLASHPAVDDVGVVGAPDETWGEVVTAYVSGDTTAEELDQWCRDSDSLADFKRPRAYTFVETVPRNPSGKIMRYQLREDE